MVELKVKAYAATAALTAEPTFVEKGRDDQQSAIFHTVSLDVAQGSAPRYDWQNKLTVRLTAQELPLFLAVLLGWVPRAEGRHHGPQKDKGYEIEHQGNKVFFKITQARQGVRAVPLTGADLLALSGLVTHQLLKNMPWLTSDSLLALVKNTIGRTHALQPGLPRASGAY